MREMNYLTITARFSATVAVVTCAPACLLLTDLQAGDTTTTLTPGCDERAGTELLTSLYQEIERACDEENFIARSFSTFEDEIRATDCISSVECTYNPLCFEGFISAREGALCQPNVIIQEFPLLATTSTVIDVAESAT